MLSPGTWYKQVPKGLEANLQFRLRLLEECAQSKSMQRAVRLACSEDILFYIAAFVWQYNPRKKGGGEVAPFIPWEFQDRAIISVDPSSPGILWAIENDEDLVVMKSREMGASWLFLIVMDWMARFRRNQQFLMISKSERAVDDPSPDSLFWKIDFMHRHLPDWLRGRVTRQKLFYRYEDTASTITGESSTGRAGVGGRATAMFIDEFPQIREDYEVLHRTSDTTGCRIFNGTHMGLDTAFYELTERVDIKKLTMHWSKHPDKWPGAYAWDAQASRIEVYDKQYAYPLDFQFDMTGGPTGGPYPGLRSPWYDKECRRKGSDRAVAMDLDINPSGSVSQFFQALLIMDLKTQYARDPLWEGDIRYDKETAKPLGLVPMPGGPLRLWCNLNVAGEPPPGPYAIGCDNSAGQGATPTCLSIVHCETGEKVGEYAHAHMEPTPFAALAVALCWWFKVGNEGAYFGWEIPGCGQIMGRRVVELGYRNIYYRENETRLRPQGTDQPGWLNTLDTKLLLLSEYREALALRQFLNHSARALNECLKFKFDSKGYPVHAGEASVNDPTGAKVNHGDQTIADAIAWKLAKKFFGGRKKEEAQRVQVGSLQWRRNLQDDRLREQVWV